MATIQIRKMTKKQRAILDAFKEKHEIGTDSGAIVELISHFDGLLVEFQKQHDRLVKSMQAHDRLIFLSKQASNCYINYINAMQELEIHLEVKGGQK